MSLKNHLIKIGTSNPALRKHLVPILKAVEKMHHRTAIAWYDTHSTLKNVQKELNRIGVYSVLGKVSTNHGRDDTLRVFSRSGSSVNEYIDIHISINRRGKLLVRFVGSSNKHRSSLRRHFLEFEANTRADHVSKQILKVLAFLEADGLL